MWHATKKTPLTNKWSDPWIYSSLRPVLNLSKSFHSLRCSLRTFDFLSLGFETKCNLLKVKLLARYLSFPRFIFKMRPFMKTAEWNPQFGIPGKQENSRCDVYFHQLRTPKNSNPVPLKKWYFAMSSRLCCLEFSLNFWNRWRKTLAQRTKLGSSYKVGPLPVINGVITPISTVITPVTRL